MLSTNRVHSSGCVDDNYDDGADWSDEASPRNKIKAMPPKQHETITHTNLCDRRVNRE